MNWICTGWIVDSCDVLLLVTSYLCGWQCFWLECSKGDLRWPRTSSSPCLSLPLSLSAKKRTTKSYQLHLKGLLCVAEDCYRREASECHTEPFAPFLQRYASILALCAACSQERVSKVRPYWVQSVPSERTLLFSDSQLALVYRCCRSLAESCCALVSTVVSSRTCGDYTGLRVVTSLVSVTLSVADVVSTH